MGVDQTHRSYVVDDAYVVKFLAAPRPPRPGDALEAHLAALRSQVSPRLRGVSVNNDGIDALVHDLVVGASDGWTWATRDLHDAILRGQQPTFGRPLGDLAGRLHLALARGSAILPSVSGRISLDGSADAAARRLDAAIDALGSAPGPSRALASVLGEAARPALDRLSRIRATPAGRVHGDLHVGQVLRSGKRYRIVDFDGHPVADASEPYAATCARDLAQLLASIDHVGAIVDRVTGAQHHDAVVSATRHVRADTAAAYLARLRRGGRPDVLDERLLEPLSWITEFVELRYAAARLRRWTYAPAWAIATRLGDSDMARSIARDAQRRMSRRHGDVA